MDLTFIDEQNTQRNHADIYVRPGCNPDNMSPATAAKWRPSPSEIPSQSLMS